MHPAHVSNCPVGLWPRVCISCERSCFTTSQILSRHTMWPVQVLSTFVKTILWCQDVLPLVHQSVLFGLTTCQGMALPSAHLSTKPDCVTDVILVQIHSLAFKLQCRHLMSGVSIPQPRSAGPMRRHGPAGTIFDSRPFDGRSTYKEMYPPQGDGADRFHRTLPPDYSAPFFGASTKQSDYVHKVPFARPATVPPHPQPRVTFNGSSTYTSEFCRKQIPEQDLTKVPDMLPSMNAPTSSMYGIDFVPLPFHARVAVCCDDNRHPAEHPSLKTRSCTSRMSTKQQRPNMSRR